MKLTPLAGRLGISVPTLNKWAKWYYEFLSPSAGESGPNVAPVFDENDVRVMATVAHLRGQGLGHDAIKRTLRSGWRVSELPWLPELEAEERWQESQSIPDDPETLRDQARQALADLDEARRRERNALERIAVLSREIEQFEWRRRSASDSELEELKEQGVRLREALDAAQQRKRGLSKP